MPIIYKRYKIVQDAYRKCLAPQPSLLYSTKSQQTSANSIFQRMWRDEGVAVKKKLFRDGTCSSLALEGMVNLQCIYTCTMMLKTFLDPDIFITSLQTL